MADFNSQVDDFDEYEAVLEAEYQASNEAITNLGQSNTDEQDRQDHHDWMTDFLLNDANYND